MKLNDFDYDLPKNLIAQKPVSPRDHSRLLILRKATGRIEHKHFYDVADYLAEGDVLVLNNTKVMAVRLIGQRAATGGKLEIFLLKKVASGGGSCVWQCLVGGKRKKEKLPVIFKEGLAAELIKDNKDGTWLVKFNKGGRLFDSFIEKIGRTPLPPYIKRTRRLKADGKNYQTVYADDQKLGSVAAPTAGLHFTKLLLNKLSKRGVRIEYVTLHVGLGTFAPVKTKNLKEHKMHAEWFEIKAKTIEAIIKAKLRNGKVVAVGTTSVRTLESVFKNLKVKNGRRFESLSGWTDIFIYPGHKFKVVDAMITNFHLPKSTLIMLVSALADVSVSSGAGRKKIFRAYREAIKKKYRFYSYGDAMLII